MERGINQKKRREGGKGHRFGLDSYNPRYSGGRGWEDQVEVQSKQKVREISFQQKIWVW
jgi:hypothetical protein